MTSKYDHLSNEEYFALEYSEDELSATGRRILEGYNKDRAKVRKYGRATTWHRYGEYIVLGNDDGKVIHAWNIVKGHAFGCTRLPEALIQKIENDERGGPVKRFRYRITNVRHEASDYK